jgi:hypothetical protein
MQGLNQERSLALDTGASSLKYSVAVINPAYTSHSSFVYNKRICIIFVIKDAK